MQNLTNEHLKESLAYLSREPEYNLFFIGDLEQFGLDSPEVTCYTADSWRPGMEFPYIILNFRQKNFLIYSHTTEYDRETAAGFIASYHPLNISGKDGIVTALLPYLTGKKAKPTYLSRLNRPCAGGQNGSFKIRQLTVEDIPAVYDLYLQIEEFAYTYRSSTREEAYDDILQNIDVIGRSYGIFQDDVLVSIAQTSAENSMSAMIVGVATLPGYRGRGYAKATVSALCNDCLEEGRQFLCLFYDNPDAGRIYRSIGFEELGAYTMLRNEE